MILLKKLYQVNTIDTSEFVLKTFNIKLINQILKRKLTMLTRKYLMLVKLLKQTDYFTEIAKIKGKVTGITGLATAVLNAVENKIPNINNEMKETELIKKPGYLWILK